MFRQFFKWSMSAIQWKKIKVSKISDCYDTARKLCLLMLNDSERFLVDVAIESTKLDENDADKSDLPFNAAGKHLKFLQNHSS